MREAMDQFFNEALLRPWLAGADVAAALPVDVQIKDDEYILHINAPSFKPEDLHIDVVGNSVHIRGESRQEQENAEGDYLLQERRFGRISRSLTLPTELDASRSEAEMDNGVLTVRVPKAETARPRSISVKSRPSQFEGKPEPVTDSRSPKQTAPSAGTSARGQGAPAHSSPESEGSATS